MIYLTTDMIERALRAAAPSRRLLTISAQPGSPFTLGISGTIDLKALAGELNRELKAKAEMDKYRE